MQKFKLPQWLRWGGKTAAPDRYAARDLLVLTNQEGTRRVAVGLVWRAIVKTGGDNQAVIMAKDARASHFCLTNSNMLGYGRLPRTPKGTSDKPILSLSLLAIRKLGNSAALLVLHIGKGEYWISRIRNGRPVATEEIVQATEQAMPGRILAILGQPDCADLVLYTDLVETGVDSARVLSLADLMDLPPIESDQLRTVQVKIGAYSGLLPKPVVWTVAVMGSAYICWNLYADYQAEEKAKVLAAARDASVQDENPTVAWQKALERLLSQLNQPSVEALQALSSGLVRLPVDWQGWKLKTVKCLPGLADKTSQKWQCVADYVVNDRARRVANNLQLAKAVPSGMTVSFAPTTHASLSWAVDSARQPISLSALPNQSDVLISTASVLQDLAPSLSNSPSYSFAPLKGLESPKRSDGRPLDRPAALALPLEARFSIQGPLRILRYLADRGIAADWRSLELNVTDYDPKQNAAASAAPNSLTPAFLNQSALMINLTGVFYAQK